MVSDGERYDSAVDRPCPLCGSPTDVDSVTIGGTPHRTCTSCNWEVAKTGPSDEPEEERLKERVWQLEQRVKDLERRLDDAE